MATEAELIEQLAQLQASKNRSLLFKSHYNKGVRVETADLTQLDESISKVQAELNTIRSGNSMSYSVPVFTHR